MPRKGSVSLPIFTFSWHDWKKGLCNQEVAPSEQLVMRSQCSQVLIPRRDQVLWMTRDVQEKQAPQPGQALAGNAAGRGPGYHSGCRRERPKLRRGGTVARPRKQQAGAGAGEADSQACRHVRLGSAVGQGLRRQNSSSPEEWPRGGGQGTPRPGAAALPFCEGGTRRNSR